MYDLLFPGGKPVKRMSKMANNFNFKQVSYSNWGEKCPIYKMMGHLATQCHKFRGMNPAERMETVKKVPLCTKCLRHLNNQKCSSEYLCYLCNKSHHTMLHINIQKREKVNTCVTATQALLATARTRVKSANGDFVSLRALIDSG